MYSCIDCEYLDKSRKNHSDKGNHNYFQYGCNKRGTDKYICGWCKDDRDLKSSALGCSDWTEKESVITETDQLPGQMSIMDFIA